MVDQGQLDCFKEKAKEEKLFLKTYKEGEAFGKFKGLRRWILLFAILLNR